MEVTNNFNISKNSTILHKNIINNNRKNSPSLKEHIGVAAGSMIGTLLPILLMKKQQNVRLRDLKYPPDKMILLSAGSIAGGIIGGVVADKTTDAKVKGGEGGLQFFNVLFPTLLIEPILTICKMVKPLNNNIVKIGLLMSGIVGGMHLGAKVSNIVTRENEEEKKRKVGAIDFLANIDVISGALVASKVPFVNKIPIEKLMPLIYTFTGYQSGKIK